MIITKLKIDLNNFREFISEPQKFVDINNPSVLLFGLNVKGGIEVSSERYFQIVEDIFNSKYKDINVNFIWIYEQGLHETDINKLYNVISDFNPILMIFNEISEIDRYLVVLKNIMVSSRRFDNVKKILIKHSQGIQITPEFWDFILYPTYDVLLYDLQKYRKYKHKFIKISFPQVSSPIMIESDIRQGDVIYQRKSLEINKYKSFNEIIDQIKKLNLNIDQIENEKLQKMDFFNKYIPKQNHWNVWKIFSQYKFTLFLSDDDLFGITLIDQMQSGSIPIINNIRQIKFNFITDFGNYFSFDNFVIQSPVYLNDNKDWYFEKINYFMNNLYYLKNYQKNMIEFVNRKYSFNTVYNQLFEII